MEKTGEKHPSFGKKRTKEQRDNISKALKGKFKKEDNPNFGRKQSEETKRKIGKCNVGKFVGEKSSLAKKVQSPSGEIYGCMEAAVKSINISRNTLTKWIKNKPEKGWKYYDKKN